MKKCRKEDFLHTLERGLFKNLQGLKEGFLIYGLMKIQVNII